MEQTPTIFISYAHKDDSVVLKIIDAMQKQGFHIWYDKGIEAGTEWPEYIAENILSCTCFLALLSKNYMTSHNCKREVNYAIEKKKDILVAYLDDVELTPGMEMQLHILQAIKRMNASSDEEFIAEICRARILQCCKAKIENRALEEPAASKSIAETEAPVMPQNVESSEVSLSEETPISQQFSDDKKEQNVILDKKETRWTCAGKYLECVKHIPGYQDGDAEVTIPYGYTVIGKESFSGCDKLTRIKIPDSVTRIEEKAFYGCSSLASIVIPDSVTRIEEEAFYGCSSLTSITIRDSVTSIGDYAFCSCCSLASIVIPDSVTSIGNAAFLDCGNLISITIPDSVASIGLFAFCGCISLPSIVIPDSVTSIEGWVFAGCRSLASIVIPDTVTSIGECAFMACTNLTSITIPDSVTSIGDDAFRSCVSLTSITIPNSVTNIEKNAFENCENITVHCKRGSFAMKYAEENGLKVEIID